VFLLQFSHPHLKEKPFQISFSLHLPSPTVSYSSESTDPTSICALSSSTFQLDEQNELCLTTNKAKGILTDSANPAHLPISAAKMEKPDSESMNHLLHYNLGLLRFENTYGQGKRKRDGNEDASYTEGTSPKRSKYTWIEAYIPQKTVSSIGNPLPQDWDAALWEKLEPAQGSANQKRPAATDDLQLTRLERDQQPKTAVGSIETPVSLGPRLKSEEPRLEAWHTDSHQYLTKAVDLPLEHDDSEMSRRSPRNTRKRAHSSITAEAVDLSSDTEQPLRQQAEQDGGEESTGLIVSLTVQDRARLWSRPPASPAPPNFEIANTHLRKKRRHTFLRRRSSQTQARSCMDTETRWISLTLQSLYHREMLTH